MKILFAPLAFVALSGAALIHSSIPAGTVLPVTLRGSLSTSRSQPGQVIKARIMQDIPLREEGKILAGSYLTGTVISVTPAAPGTSARISFKFDRLVRSHGSVPIVLTLRAVASILEIRAAQQLRYADPGSPQSANTTFQVGGEVVYRGGGHVMSGRTIVGEPLLGDDVLGRIRANPDGNCEGAIDGNDQPQALWLFSSDACGVYGYSHVRIVHAGRTPPLGEMVLTSERGEINIQGGTGMLLRVILPPSPDSGF